MMTICFGKYNNRGDHTTKLVQLQFLLKINDLVLVPGRCHFQAVDWGDFDSKFGVFWTVSRA